MDENALQDAIANPKNVGEMEDADAVGTVGSPECGDMVRMWIKYKEGEGGKKLIDKASFQSFGCQTAIAVASVATEIIAGKTPEEALSMSAEDLSGPIGALPPMKIHCGQMVEGALKEALEAEEGVVPASEGADGSPVVLAETLSDSLPSASSAKGGIRIVPIDDEDED